MQSHNKKILSDERQTEDLDETCNCQKKQSCPTPGKCRSQKVVYQATVKHNNKEATYIGNTATEFKRRYRNHTKSFRLEQYKTETCLSQYVWENELSPNPNIEWKFVRKCKTYTPGSKCCDLCLSEKFEIIKNLRKPNTINKRTDIGNRCPHQTMCALQTTGGIT